MIKSDSVDGNIVSCLFTVYYDSIPSCNLGRTYFEFKKPCEYSLFSASEIFKKYYWKLLHKSRSESFRFFTNGALDAYRVDVEFFKGSERLSYMGTLFLFTDPSDPFNLKDFLSHPDEIYYEQLSLFDDPYWRY